MKIVTILFSVSFVTFACSKSDFNAGGATPVKKPEESANLGKVEDDDPIEMENDGETPPPPVEPVIAPDDGGNVRMNCQFKAPRTGLTKDGFVVYLDDAYKPGVPGTPTATEGVIWYNGGTAKKYGTAPSTLDWNLCPKIAFHERGHSVTRTINFKAEAKDAEYELIIHRIRSSGENGGVGIWYHWDPRVTWKAGPLRFFVALKDYKVKCAYTAATDKFLCEHSESALTSTDCAARTVNRPWLACQPMVMAP